MSAPIEVLVSPVGSGNYAATVGGAVVVKSSKTPLLAAARFLLAHDIRCRDLPLTMRHRGSHDIALSTKVGFAARRTVEDDATGRPVFAPWRH